MPALPAASNVAKIQMVGSYGQDVNVLNTVHCKFTGSPQVSDCNNWALAVHNAWVSHMAPLISGSYTLNNVIVTDLTSSTGAVGSDVANAPGTGSASGVPAGVALVVRFEISRRYRGGHPRQYIAGVPSAEVTGENEWSSTYISTFEAAYLLFATSISGFSDTNVQGTQIVNLSYVDGHNWVQDSKGNWHRAPVYRTVPATDPVSAYIVNPVLGSMRRRNEQP
jgi:hypothetical protein